MFRVFVLFAELLLAIHIFVKPAFAGSRIEPTHIHATFSISDGDIVFGAKEVEKWVRQPWIARRDTQGKVLWEKVFKEKIPSEFTTALRMPNGDYLAGGGGIGIGGGDCGALFVRIDRNGKVLWKRTLSPRSLQVSRMIVTSDGGIAAVGSISSNRIHSWRWVARLSAEGRVLWQKSFNKENGLAYHLTVLPNGDIIIAGEMAADCACEGHQDTEPWAARVNGKGKVIWEKKLGAGLAYRGENPKSFATFYADTLKPTSENELVLKGRTFEFSRKEVEKETGSWTLRFDSNGNVTAKSLKKFDNPKMLDGN